MNTSGKTVIVTAVMFLLFTEVSSAEQIEVLWLGHATTYITSTTGKVIVIDPFPNDFLFRQMSQWHKFGTRRYWPTSTPCRCTSREHRELTPILLTMPGYATSRRVVG